MLNFVKCRRASAPALLLTLGAAWLSPCETLAQLSPVPGNLVVTITSPTSGSRVGAAVTVSASVSAAGSAVVTAVQFKLDGAHLGAEVATAPYSVSWNAATVSDGWHTLTALARDARGLQFASDPVTVRVSNAVPTPTAVQRYEETDASVTYSVGWMQRNPDDWLAWSGGSAVQAMTPGATATFAFTGTSVTWIGYRSTDSGLARVLVDGVFVSDIDLFARTDESSARVFTVTGLTPSRHTLTIEVTGLKNPDSALNNIVVDAFDVPGPLVSHLQDTDPSISYSAGWAGGDTSKPRSGGDATISATPNARATFTFNGSAISWIGHRGPDAGTARVWLDGSFVREVDTYSPNARVQDIVFMAEGLDDGTTHTLTIETTGLKNAASAGTSILLDAFDVTTSGTRFQETDWSVTYTGDWTHGNRNRPWSEGTATVTGSPGAQATFSFAGTSVSWIGFRAGRTGIARVYLDGTFVTEVDTYALSEGFQNTVFRATGLADGSHTLTIEATGSKNPASTNSYIVVDAFDVRP